MLTGPTNAAQVPGQEGGPQDEGPGGEGNRGEGETGLKGLFNPDE